MKPQVTASAIILASGAAWLTAAEQGSAEGKAADASLEFQVAMDGELAGPDNQVWDMAVFKGALYALAAARPMGVSGGRLLKYDGEVWSVAFQFTHEQGVFRMHATEDRLFIAGADSTKGPHGWVYLWDGKKMVERQVKIHGCQTEHNIAIAHYKGSLFVVNALKQPGGGPARIFRSDDDGRTWVQSFARGANWHPNALYPTKNALYAAVGQVVLLQAPRSTAWKEVRVEGQKRERASIGFGLARVSCQILDFAEHKGAIYACGDRGVWCTRSGKAFARSLSGQDRTFWGLASHRGALYAACGERILTSPEALGRNGKPLTIPYGAPGAEHILPDGKNDAQVWRLAKPGTKWSKVADLPEDRATSVASFQDDLYVGTGARGRAYVFKTSGTN